MLVAASPLRFTHSSGSRKEKKKVIIPLPELSELYAKGFYEEVTVSNAAASHLVLVC